MIDLYSDTVSAPTKKMYDAMRDAPLGDAIAGDCPTVRRLEEMAAEMLGKEAAALTPGGMMANLLGVMIQSEPGQAVLTEMNAHLYRFGIIGTVGRTPIPIEGERGLLTADQIREQLDGINWIPFGLITLENPHNFGGGTILPLKEMKAIAEVAWSRGVSVHLDGARIFNAVASTGIPAREYARWTNTVMFCLSKGLGAPVGSLLAGDGELIERARRLRYTLGGGMRKAGVIAAAGIVALETMVDRMKEDTENARTLARGLAEIPGLGIDVEGVQTNIVKVDVSALGADAEAVADALKERGVRVSLTGRALIRMVTYFGITPEDIERAIEIFSEVARSLGPAQPDSRR